MFQSSIMIVPPVGQGYWKKISDLASTIFIKRFTIKYCIRYSHIKSRAVILLWSHRITCRQHNTCEPTPKLRSGWLSGLNSYCVSFVRLSCVEQVYRRNKGKPKFLSRFFEDFNPVWMQQKKLYARSYARLKGWQWDCWPSRGDSHLFYYKDQANIKSKIIIIPPTHFRFYRALWHSRPDGYFSLQQLTCPSVCCVTDKGSRSAHSLVSADGSLVLMGQSGVLRTAQNYAEEGAHRGWVIVTQSALWKMWGMDELVPWQRKQREGSVAKRPRATPHVFWGFPLSLITTCSLKLTYNAGGWGSGEWGGTLILKHLYMLCKTKLCRTKQNHSSENSQTNLSYYGSANLCMCVCLCGCVRGR